MANHSWQAAKHSVSNIKELHMRIRYMPMFGVPVVSVMLAIHLNSWSFGDDSNIQSIPPATISQNEINYVDWRLVTLATGGVTLVVLDQRDAYNSSKDYELEKSNSLRLLKDTFPALLRDAKLDISLCPIEHRAFAEGRTGNGVFWVYSPLPYDILKKKLNLITSSPPDTNYYEEYSLLIIPNQVANRWEQWAQHPKLETHMLVRSVVDGKTILTNMKDVPNWCKWTSEILDQFIQQGQYEYLYIIWQNNSVSIAAKLIISSDEQLDITLRITPSLISVDLQKPINRPTEMGMRYAVPVNEMSLTSIKNWPPKSILPIKELK